MKTKKQYIKNNKQLLLVFTTMILFLIIQNYAYCDLSFFQKWYLNTENYFLTLTWEKAISDPVDISKSIGWVCVGDRKRVVKGKRVYVGVGLGGRGIITKKKKR